MLARKNQYDYAEEFYYPEEKKVVKKKVIRKKKKSKKALIAFYKSMIFTITIVTMASFMFILSRYAKITAINSDINRLEKESVELGKEKLNLSAEINRLKTSENIMEDATVKLGMDFPSEDQLLYVDIDNKIEAEVEDNIMDKFMLVFKGLF